MAGLLWTAGILVFLAGFQLFVLTESTERYFAWTIDPPLTAAFLGASYWSSAVFEWTAARRRYWGEARIAVPAVFTFTVLTLVISLIHLDRLHLGTEFETVTRTVTWLWLAIYVTVPLLMAGLWIRQQAMLGTDPDAGVGLPGWLRMLLWVHAGGLGAFGIGLLTAPDSVGSLWPWPLTPLTSRAIGAWLVSLAVVAVHLLWSNSAGAGRSAGWAYVVFGILQAIALIRYPGDLVWSSPTGIVYLAFLASAVVIGTAIVVYGRTSSRAQGVSG
jgi:hypothetical protein